MDELVDGVLDAEVAGRVRSHLAACADCAAEMEALGRVRRRLAGLPAEPLPPGFADRLGRRLALAEPPRRVRWRAAALPAATAVAGFLLAAALASPLLPGHGARAALQAKPSSPARAAALQGPRAGDLAVPSPAAGATAGAAVSAATLFRAAPSGAGTAPRPGSAHVAHGAASPRHGSARPASAVFGALALPPTAGAAAASGTGPAPLAVTLLAADPAQAFSAARVRVAAAGGEMSETLVPVPVSLGGPRLAGTVDAVLPTGAANRLLGALRRYGTVLSTVGGAAGAAAPPAEIRLLVSVLDVSAPPVVAHPTPRPASALRGSLGGMRRLAGSVLAAAATAAPWAALAAAIGLLGWGVATVSRRMAGR